MMWKVEGYFCEDDRMALQRAVLKSRTAPGDLLEIGNLNGLSALCTLAVMHPDKKLVLVDIADHHLVETLARYDVMDKCEIHRMDFREFAKLNPDRTWSHVMIDHDHAYQSNVEAIEAFWPQLSVGGIMTFHDVGHGTFPGVKQAVDEFKVKHNPIPFCEQFTSCYIKRE